MSNLKTLDTKKVDKVQEKPNIVASKNKFWQWFANFMFSRLVRGRFYSMRVKNPENFELRDKSKATIIIANHCCWWDGQVIYLLNKNYFHKNFFMMIEELYRMPLLSKIGAFSVEKNSPQDAVKALKYAAELLSDKESLVHIFPQGKVLPPDFRPIEFSNGVAYLAEKTDGLNIVPIAHRYNFIREDKPEVFVEVGKPIIINSGEKRDRKAFTHELEKVLTDLLDKQRSEICQGNLEGYDHMFKSKLGNIKLFEKHFKVFIRNLT